MELLAGRREMGPKWNNFASPENEPEDEAFASDYSKVLRPWEGVTFSEPGGKVKRKGKKIFRE